MLDVSLIRNSPDLIKENLKKRKQEEKLKFVDDLLFVDDEWRKLKNLNDRLRAERNKLTLEITKLKKKDKKVSDLVSKASSIPRKIDLNDKKMVKLREKIDYYLLRLPNVVHDSVPDGLNEKDNAVVRRFGRPVKGRFESHGVLMEKFGLADFGAGRRNAGAGFNYLIGGLAQLDLALQRFGVDFLISKGFTLVVPPIMLNRETLSGSVNLSDFEDVVYKIEGCDLYLIGTAENSLVSMFKDKTLGSLPVKVCAVTPCFRKEIGSHGVDTRGLFRMHQFNKVEQVVFSNPSDSYRILEQMQKITEEFFKKLGLSFRVVEICSGDLGDKQSKQYDIEAWFPRQGRYAEVTSCSNCTDYQARRLNVRYLDRNNKRRHVHILNNTMVATSRAMVAILENFKTKDGIVIPKVLKPYMNGVNVLKHG